MAEYATIDWTWGKRLDLWADGEDDGNSRGGYFQACVGLYGRSSQYKSAKKAKILFWAYKPDFKLTTSIARIFDSLVWAYMAFYEVTASNNW